MDSHEISTCQAQASTISDTCHSGKTMLAAIILRDELVRKTFDRIGFVSIGQVRTILCCVSLRVYNTLSVDAQSVGIAEGAI